MKRIGVWTLVLWLFGCGGAANGYKTAYGEPLAPPEAAMEESYDMYSEAAPSPGGNKSAAEFDFQDGAPAYAESKKDRMTEAPSAAPMKSDPVTTPPTDSVDGTDEPASNISATVESQNDPMIIYSGYLQLRVKRLLDAVDQITALVEKKGGYVDSLTQTAIVVRIPGKDFDGTMAELAAVGDLLDRWVRAQDVTEQFTDLKGRLTVAEEARERLLKLLEKVENVSDRLRILQEIKRLSEMIDTIESSLAAIRNLVDYFTITIDLVPVLAVERVDTGLSPFPWIRELKAHTQTLYEGNETVSMKPPKGFVIFDEEDNFRAQAADTSVIRAAALDNEPKGDNRFWIDAFDFEMTTRQEKIIESAEAGKLTYRVYENDDVTPRFYLVALQTAADKIYVVEVFYPNKDAFVRHHAQVVKALETVEVK